MNFLSKNFKKISTQLLIMEIDFCPVDQMAWVRAANQHRAIAEEIILTCVRLELYLNEGGKVVDCNLIIM